MICPTAAFAIGLKGEEAMAPDLKALGIEDMSVDDRLSLVLAIWESIDKSRPESLLSAEQHADLQRRIEAADADPTAGRPWSEVRADLLGRP
jgi:putative addiction module component (TIGR02574 family)